jgi:hypothetical protein
MKRTLSFAAAAVSALTAVAAVLWLALPAGASPATQSAVSGIENFQLMTTSATATTIPIIAYGLFTASGVNHTGKNVDTVVFSNGSFKINHAGVVVHFKLDPKTCLIQASGTGKVTLSGGTGAYKGISGTPVATLSILGIAARSAAGKCSMAKPPVAFQQLIKASGKITL